MIIKNYHHVELSAKPDFEDCMNRIYAWLNNDIVDRVPVRFIIHNSFVKKTSTNKEFKSYKERWFDSEYQISTFRDNMNGLSLKGETFPIYWCNLGPNVYSAYFGTELTYDERGS